MTSKLGFEISSGAPPQHNLYSQSETSDGRIYTYNLALFKEFGRFVLDLFFRALACLIPCLKPAQDSSDVGKAIAKLKKPCAQLDQPTLTAYFDYLKKASRGTLFTVMEFTHLAAQNTAYKTIKNTIGSVLCDHSIKFVSIPVTVKGTIGDHIVHLLVDQETKTIEFFDSNGLSIHDKKNIKAKCVRDYLNSFFHTYVFKEDKICYQGCLDSFNCAAFVAMHVKNRVLVGPPVGGKMNILDFRHNVMTTDLESVYHA